MSTTSPAATDPAADLRADMVDGIIAYLDRVGITVTPQVEQALRTVPRHLFTEDAALEVAYGNGAVVTNRSEDGRSLSSVSAAWLQAAQLLQAGVRAGHRVLEIGSGGYNAALIREIVGPTGSVTSIDIDPDVIARARRCLASAGYDDIDLICMDAEHPIPGPTFDAIIVTVGAWDISPAWIQQLTEHGRLVVPLRTMSLTRSWELERTADTLLSRSDMVCGFIQMRGDGASRGRNIVLEADPEVGLWCDEGQDTGIDEQAMAGVLGRERTEVWTDVSVDPREIYSNQDLWLATRLPGYCHITADAQALASGIVDLRWEYGQPAIARGASLAYRPPARPVDEAKSRYVIGVIAHGPDGGSVAQEMADAITAWDQAGRPSPVLSVHPAGTPDPSLPEGFVLDKRHTRLVISWRPTAAR